MVSKIQIVAEVIFLMISGAIIEVRILVVMKWSCRSSQLY